MSRQVLTVAADGTGDCRTVAQAVARARTGAVVSIAPGRYEESVTVAVSITLSAAEGRGTVELAPRRGPALTLTGDAVMVSDLVLRGHDDELPVVDVPRGQLALNRCDVHGSAWAALFARGGGSLALRQCRISNPAGAGVVATSGTESLLEDCVVEHLGTSAVVAGERGRISVRASRLRDARGNGVLANGQAHVLVEDCEISAADKPGVAVEQDSSVRVVRGTVRECVVGVFVNSTGRTVLEDVTVRDTTGHGFVVGAGSSPTLSGCRSERTAGHGLLVAERSRGTVRDCVFTAAEEPAVRVCGFSSPVLTGVVVRDAEGTGLLLDEDSAAELDRLEVLDAGGSGIVIRPGANPLVRRATVARCGGHGVEVSKDGRGRLEDCAVEEPSGSTVHVSGHGNLYVGGGRAARRRGRQQRLVRPVLRRLDGRRMQRELRLRPDVRRHEHRHAEPCQVVVEPRHQGPYLSDLRVHPEQRQRPVRGRASHHVPRARERQRPYDQVRQLHDQPGEPPGPVGERGHLRHEGPDDRSEAPGPG
ncbi:right-handed parallel beta-helix repeat-containing protein [Streptomyces sp. NPDC058770]|uniref:right-handed parallel beta-helix repeat-containing protein n=1 Tax=Streptomyces sp. NPDC058770 TaxID=3346631 RepID=UPI0036A9217A